MILVVLIISTKVTCLFFFVLPFSLFFFSVLEKVILFLVFTRLSCFHYRC